MRYRVPGDPARAGPGAAALRRAHGGGSAAQGESRRQRGTLALCDLLGLLPELAEVLARAVLRDQRVGSSEPPSRELHGDPSVQPLELAAAFRAAARGRRAHWLDLLDRGATGSAP